MKKHIYGAMLLIGALAMPALAYATNHGTLLDVEAASRAYIDALDKASHAKSDAYFVGGYWLLLWGAVVSILSSWILLRTRWSARMRNWAERISKRRWLVPALYALPYTVISTLIVLPWTIYTGYFREKQYDLLNQSFFEWAKEQGIALVIAILSTAVVMALVFAVIRKSPKRWWLWGAVAMTGVTGFAALIAPVFIAPLFNTYKELPAGPVRDRIVAMAKANHVPAEHIYLFDQSKQHKRISANVSGLGPTIRISLNDNLLNRSTEAEIASVMGHELGHYVLNHVWRIIAVFALMFLGGFWLMYRITPVILARWGQKWGVHDSSDPAVVPVFIIITSAFFLVVTPLTNTVIRMNESEADMFGLNTAHEPDAFASIAIKTSEYRKVEPGAVEEFLFYDHPSPATRVRMAMQWKADHRVKTAPISATEK